MTSIRLLVVDDQAAIRDALAVMLDLDPDIAVVGTAANGKDAITAVDEHDPQVVLMDLHMPVMDGLQATGCIRATPDGASQRTPIVALSAAALPEDRARCAAAGMDDFISKPVSLAQLRRCIVTSMAGAAQR